MSGAPDRSKDQLRYSFRFRNRDSGCIENREQPGKNWRSAQAQAATDIAKRTKTSRRAWQLIRMETLL